MTSRILASGALALLVGTVACKRSRSPENSAVPLSVPAPVQPATKTAPAAPEQSVTAHLRLSGRKFGTEADVSDCQDLEIALDPDRTAPWLPAPRTAPTLETVPEREPVPAHNVLRHHETEGVA